MGWRYVLYRLWYELKRKTGLLKKKFPTNPKDVVALSLEEWRNEAKPFFFDSKEKILLDKKPTEILMREAENILKGRIRFFSGHYYDLGLDYDWVTNPDSGYKYDISKHWTEVNDYSKEAGDIKYAWEKSRFTYLNTIIRYDYHFNIDCSQFVFDEINSWIEHNPINKGPNYKCSQEISLRLLNWIFALYYYRNSQNLTEQVFQKIVYYVYWQLHHVYNNINFSRITVRNNHAITETLTIYIVSLLFPQFPQSVKWKKQGKVWFEQEIKYQIYDDGTFLQFSMNYHRVVIQLLTWAVRIADLNQEKFEPYIYEKAYKSLNFLYQCQEDSNGYLPNYGSNDGALFFKLSNNDYRDYRPQLDALHQLLINKGLYKESQEDICWYGNTKSEKKYPPLKKEYGVISFPASGYYLIREKETLTFIRCGKHKDRPAHADNLHVDIWYKGENLLPDGGTYKYNTDNRALKYFAGTESHNTIMLDDYDQMLKGERFIWYHWTQAIGASVTEQSDAYIFSGAVNCFTYLNKAIIHHRKIIKYKDRPEWMVEDLIENKPVGVKMRQLWHTKSEKRILFKSLMSEMSPVISTGEISEYYGQKDACTKIEYYTTSNQIKMVIKII